MLGPAAVVDMVVAVAMVAAMLDRQVAIPAATRLEILARTEPMDMAGMGAGADTVTVTDMVAASI